MKKNITKVLSIILSTALIMSVFAGCSLNNEAASTSEAADNGKINVVCTLFPQYDFVRAIAGDKVNLTMLLKPGNESHSYEASLSDINTIKNSDLFIYVGGETDGWVDSIISSTTNENFHAIALTDLVTTLKENSDGILVSEEEEEESGDAYDEHVWTSIKNAGTMVNSLCDTLCQIDSENSDMYKTNAQAYVKQLSALDTEYQNMVDAAKTKTIVIADRNPFRYMFNDYGINAVAAFNGCTSNTEITLDVLQQLTKAVKGNNLNTVFVIEFNKSTYADSICKETGCTKQTLNSCHNVTKEDFDSGVTYLDLMTKNLTALEEAMN